MLNILSQWQQPLLWLCTAVEVLLAAPGFLASLLPKVASHALAQTVCAQAYPSLARLAPQLRATPLTITGVALVACGCALRLICYKKLGPLFTFDLTIFPSHTLVTSGPYGVVRHPAYTGTLFMCSGILLVNFTPGSWITECGVLGTGMTGVAIRAIVACLWYGWWLSVGVYRCRSEDAELRKTFGKEWDAYAAKVRWWFVPYVM